MLNRLRAALARAEDHWLADVAGVCILFAIPPVVMFLGLALGVTP